MKNLKLIIGLIFSLAVLALFGLFSKEQLSCKNEYRNDTQITINGNVIKAEVVDERAEREKGLGGRTCIGEDQSMLFIFDRPGSYPIWMKDMKFPIDIIWISESKQVVKVQSNVAQDTYPQTFANEKPAKYVLEMQAGRAAGLGIQAGTPANFSR